MKIKAYILREWEEGDATWDSYKTGSNWSTRLKRKEIRKQLRELAALVAEDDIGTCNYLAEQLDKLADKI